MKDKSTIKKKELKFRREMMSIEKKGWPKLEQWEKTRHRYLENYRDALCWVLGKDDVKL